MSRSQSIRDLEIDSSASKGVRSGPPPQYIDLDKIKNVDGITAIISQRLSTRMITYAISKEFERDGRTERTSFIAETLRESYLSVIDLAFKRIDEIKASAKVMLELQLEAIGRLPEGDQEYAARQLQISLKRGAK